MGRKRKQNSSTAPTSATGTAAAAGGNSSSGSGGDGSSSSTQLVLPYIKSELITIATSQDYGRYLKSKKAIKSGQVILKEKYLLVGPKIGTKFTICIGCHSVIQKKSPEFSCPKCHWQLCNPKCASSPFHPPYECTFLHEHNIRPSPDVSCGCLTVLRGLLLKLSPSSTGSSSSSSWGKLLNLQSHDEERREDEHAWVETMDCVRTIRETWGLAELFSEDEIIKVCGIFTINSFEMGDCYSFGGIFPTSSMCSHNCVPNATQNELIDELSLEIRAMVDIPVGEPITLCYDSCLKGTMIRRSQLRKTKYFDCVCPRCVDPTELGTNFSTMTCAFCKKGAVTREQLLQQCTTNAAAANWKCNKCSKTVADSSVHDLVKKWSSISETKNDIKSQEEFLRDCKAVFHTNHFVPFAIKFSLCMAYGREAGYELERLTNNSIHRKLELCQDVLKILNVLTPGLSISRGHILYEQQAAEVLIVKNLIENDKCSRNLLKARLVHALAELNEAIVIFDMNYAMKMLAESSRNTTKKELENWIATFK